VKDRPPRYTISRY